MKVREFFSFRRIKRGAVLFALLFSVAGSLFIVNSVHAAGDVILTGSAFSDPDAEDTHKASQWIITDAPGGGSTIYDSGTDAVNLTTITVSGAFFLSGSTYYWKVRYQDNHDVWSDYSDEASFTYGSGGSATPTPEPTATGTSTVTSTATATVTATSTATPELTPGPTVPPYVCRFGWRVVDNKWICSDPEIRYFSIYVPEEATDFCAGSTISITYYFRTDGFDNEQDILKAYRDWSSSADAPVHDIYISTDDGSSYTRVEHDFDPMPGATVSTLPASLKLAAVGRNKKELYLKVTHTVKVPDGMVSDPGKTRILVHVANNRHPMGDGDFPVDTVYEPNGGQDLGNSFLFHGGSYLGYAGPIGNGDPMDFTNAVSSKDCLGLTPTPTPTVTSTASQCLYDFISPSKEENWADGSTQQISWVGKNELSEQDLKISAYLLAGSGPSKSSIAVMEPDNGVLTYMVKPHNSARSGRILLETYNRDDVQISSCTSGIISLKYPNGSGDPATTLGIVLVLGSIFALFASYIAALVASIPALSRMLSSIAASLFAPPIWPQQKSKWGIVYDALTKKPIPNVVVRMFSEPDGKLRDSRRSNEAGEFGFIVPIGSYSVTASKSGYSFPSHLVIGSFDNQYHNIYKGGEVDVHPAEGGKAPLNINIPMDQSKANILDITALTFIHFVSKVASIIRKPLLALGTVFITYLTITQSRWYDYLILALYIGLWAFEIADLMKKRTYGVVANDSGQPVYLAMVRIVDRSNKLRGSAVTGDDGKFIISLPQGEYRFEASRAGYVSDKSEYIKINKMADIGKINLRLKKLVNQELYPEQDHSKL